MRKILKSIMLVAAAAMAFASCQKQEIVTPETFSTTITVGADVEQTKTYLGEDNWVLWGKAEALTLYVGAGETAKFFDSAPTDDYDGKTEASFTVNIEDVATAYSYSLGGIYPASAAMDDNKNAKQYKVILPATQNQVDGKYDPSAYIMVLKPEVVTKLPSKYTASFRRAVALNKITLTGVKEDISSVEITVPEKKYLAGRRYMDLTTGESGEVYYDQSNKVTVNSSFTGNSIDVWFTSWGVELAEGDELSIKMTSATKTYTRTIAARAEGIKFVEGNLNKLTVNMSDATVETLDNFSGEYLIVNTDLTRAAQAWDNGNNLPEFVLNARDGVVYESEEIENCKMTIEAQADGKYTIKDANGLYLYAASSSSNHLKGKKEASSWTIEQDGDKYVLTSSAQTSRNIMQYNEQSKIFSCYSSGQKDITLYKYSDIKPDTNPSVSVEETTSPSIGAEGGNLTFTCTTKNLDGETLEVVEESEYLTWSVAENVVTITVAANEAADSRTLNATIKCGSIEVPVTITQAGKPAEGAPVEVTDVLTRTTTGVASGAGYSNWSGKTETSSAVYAGQSAGGNDAIQLRSKNNNSGVVTTTSGGKVKKIKVTWQSSTVSGRTLDIYGKNSAYTAASDLYDSSKQGTKLGSIKCGTSTELAISGDYEYIGFRSNSDALYLTDVEITWETSGSGGDVTPDPEQPETPVEPTKLSTPVVKCSDSDITENSLKFTWDAVANASKYEVTFDNGNPTVTTNKYYEATGLKSNTQYTISVKAVGDDVNYTTSDAGTATGTTKEEQQPGGGIVAGTAYSYTFTAKQWSANGAKTLNGLSWTLAGDGGYWGNDSTKGHQFGSGSAPYKSMTLSTTAYSGGVKKIVINTSGASSINAKLTVTVGGVQIGSTVSLTSSAKEYTFEVPGGGMYEGEIIFSYTQTSSKALYIKSIKIN